MSRKGLLTVLLSTAALFGVAVAVLGWDLHRFLDRPNPHAIDIVIENGWSLKRISAFLEEREVVGSGQWFTLLARHYQSGHIQAGHYHLVGGETPAAVLHLLRSGAVVQRRVVIPEGLTVQRAGDLLEEAGLAEIHVLLADSELPKRLNWPESSLEGALFPDTYFIREGESGEALLSRMVSRALKVLQEEWDSRPEGFSLSVYETLILASIVEKETGRADERPHIAGVFHNRLRKGMRLQSDPTVIYGVAGFQRPLTRRHLRTPTPFNTYTIDGLPPTPICNPGRAAIHAVLHPETTRDIFFVARGDGSRGHFFAKTLAEHERNVAVYRRRLRSGDR